MAAGSSVTIDQLRASDRTTMGPALVTGIAATAEPWGPQFIVDQVGEVEVPIRRITGGDYIGSVEETVSIADYWWHGIQNLDEVSLTAVYFWSQDWRYTWRDLTPKQLPPPGMRADYARDLARRYVVKPARGLMAKVKR